MKTVILAGGYGTRISEESQVKPKPMVEIGGMPILWHIMKIYSAFGLNEFLICCGYKGHIIKEFFDGYALRTSDVKYDLKLGTRRILSNGAEPWKVTLIDTGDATMTGGRLKRIADHIRGETFCLTYGDGVCDVDIAQLVEFHHSHGKLVTLTAVQQPGRFGALELRKGDVTVRQFREKPSGDGAWINGGFFVLEPEAIEYIDGDDVVWEKEPMERLAQNSQLAAFRHSGFWHPMDTLRDRMVLEELWREGNAPWDVWREPNRRIKGHPVSRRQAALRVV